jgi:hypothetical protein
VIYDETIVYALTHPEGVRYDSTPQTLERDREELRKSAIKMTPKPITIFTRTHDFYPYNPYLLVKQFDPTSMETIKGGPNPHGTRV